MTLIWLLVLLFAPTSWCWVATVASLLFLRKAYMALPLEWLSEFGQPEEPALIEEMEEIE